MKKKSTKEPAGNKFALALILLVIVALLIWAPTIQLKTDVPIGTVTGCYWHPSGHIVAMVFTKIQGEYLVQSRYAGRPCMGNW